MSAKTEQTTRAASAQPPGQPDNTPRGFLIIDDEYLACLWTFSRKGGALPAMLEFLMRAINRRQRKGLEGTSPVIRTETIAEALCCGRHTVNQQVRAALELRLFERWIAPDALEKGMINDEEESESHDGYVYRLLMENWAAAAAKIRSEWESAASEPASASQSPEPAEPPRDLRFFDEPVRVEVGNTQPVKLRAEVRQRLVDIETIQIRSSLANAVDFAPAIEGSALVVEIGPPAGNYNYRFQPVENEQVTRDVRKLLKPHFMRLFSKLPDETLVAKIARSLEGCPVFGSKPVCYQYTVEARVKQGGDIRTGLFFRLAESARDAWVELAEMQQAERAAAPQATERDREQQLHTARSILEHREDYKPHEVEWAETVIEGGGAGS